MSPSKPKCRKVHCENCHFQSKWSENCLFTWPHTMSNKPAALLCSESIAVMKEYDMERRYKYKWQRDESKRAVSIIAMNSVSRFIVNLIFYFINVALEVQSNMWTGLLSVWGSFLSTTQYPPDLTVYLWVFSPRQPTIFQSDCCHCGPRWWWQTGAFDEHHSVGLTPRKVYFFFKTAQLLCAQ